MTKRGLLDQIGRTLDRRFRGWRPALLLTGSLLAVVLAVAIMPHGQPLPPEPPIALFSSEPEIRVLLATLASGDSIEIEGRPLAFSGRDARLGGRALELPATLGPAAPGEGILAGPHRYPGLIEIRASGDSVLVINKVGLETYLEGVIEAEMGLHYPDEALAAQAACARSYAVVRIAARRSSPWDLGNTQSHQVYRGLTRNPARSRDLVARSTGLILTYGGKPIEGLYSSTCGGRTRCASEAFGGPAMHPLRGVACGACDGESTASWTARAPADALRPALGGAAPRRVLRLERTPGERLLRAHFETDRGNASITGTALKQALGRNALSTWITGLDLRDGRITARGRGFGHGVGLCQTGARQLARRGAAFRQILAHYYPDAELRTAWPIAP